MCNDYLTIYNIGQMKVRTEVFADIRLSLTKLLMNLV